MPERYDIELEIKKASKLLGELIERHSSSIRYKDGLELALEGILSEMRLGKDRRAELLWIEADKIMQKERKSSRRMQYPK